MAIISCVDCGDIAGPDNPKTFTNIRPKEQRKEFGGLWACEDCRGQREHIADTFGLTRPTR